MSPDDHVVVASVGYHVFTPAQKHQSGMAQSERVAHVENYNRDSLSVVYYNILSSTTKALLTFSGTFTMAARWLLHPLRRRTLLF